jgi:hypothetical protein
VEKHTIREKENSKSNHFQRAKGLHPGPVGPDQPTKFPSPARFVALASPPTQPNNPPPQTFLRGSIRRRRIGPPETIAQPSRQNPAANQTGEEAEQTLTLCAEAGRGGGECVQGLEPRGGWGSSSPAEGGGRGGGGNYVVVPADSKYLRVGGVERSG